MATVADRTARRTAKVRRNIRAAANGRARLSVFRSSKHIYAQVIDDDKGETLAVATIVSPPMFTSRYSCLHSDSPDVAIEILRPPFRRAQNDGHSIHPVRLIIRSPRRAVPRARKRRRGAFR